MTTPENTGNELGPATGNLPEIVPGQIEPRWESPSTALQVSISGAYLGRITGRDGWNNGFKDTHEEVVPDAGLVFVVSQSSAGGTYLSAKAMQGHQVEALNPDASSRRSMWRSAPEWDDKVGVDSDWGKMAKYEPGQDWNGINFGNPGVRSGIVRVTNPEGAQRYYVIGADFRGEPDSWRVSGDLCEVWPNEQLELAITPRQLTGSLDPSLVLSPAKGEIEQTVRITGAHLDEIAAAFEETTSEVHILHADREGAIAGKTFSDASLALLIEVAKSRPDMLQGTEEQVDELGRRARLITRRDGGNIGSGYLDRLASDEENRLRYLESVQENIRYATSNSDTAHSFTFFTKQALDILKAGFENGAAFNLATSSPLTTELHNIISTARQQTAAAQTRRTETLQGTVLDPESRRKDIAYKVAIPGQKVEINLEDITPLLTEYQTAEAFYTASGTDAGSKRAVNHYEPTLVMLDIGGKRFALTEAQRSRDFRGGYNSKRQFNLLHIVDPLVNPRHGVQVSARDLSFGGDYDRDIQTIYDDSNKPGGSYLSGIDTNVTIEFDDEDNKLTILSPYKKVGVMGAADAIDTKQWEAGDSENLEQRLKVAEWKRALRSVVRDTDNLRSRLESQLTASIESGRLSPEVIERRKAEIVAEVARGPVRSRTYNGYQGDKWHRSQSYHVTADEQGNIWGDFEEVGRRSDVTGQPLPAGRHLMHRNPNIPRSK